MKSSHTAPCFTGQKRHAAFRRVSQGSRLVASNALLSSARRSWRRALEVLEGAMVNWTVFETLVDD